MNKKLTTYESEKQTLGFKSLQEIKWSATPNEQLECLQSKLECSESH